MVAKYASGVTYDPRIARTGGANTGIEKYLDPWTNQYVAVTVGSRDIVGSDPILYEAASDSTLEGQIVNKMGATTGWTRGEVLHTCVDRPATGSSHAVLCQTVVRAGSWYGDSGSPVFLGPFTLNLTTFRGTFVGLLGILWGGNGTDFVYSPIRNVEYDLMPLTVRF